MVKRRKGAIKTTPQPPIKKKVQCRYVDAYGKRCTKEMTPSNEAVHFYNVHKMNLRDWIAGCRPKTDGEKLKEPKQEPVSPDKFKVKEKPKDAAKDPKDPPREGGDLDDILRREGEGRKAPDNQDELDKLAVDPESCKDLFIYGAELIDDIGLTVKEHLDKAKPNEKHRYKPVRMPESRARTLGHATSEIIGPQKPEVVLAAGTVMAYVPSLASILFMVGGPKIKDGIDKFLSAVKHKADAARKRAAPPAPQNPPKV